MLSQLKRSGRGVHKHDLSRIHFCVRDMSRELACHRYVVLCVVDDTCTYALWTNTEDQVISSLVSKNAWCAENHVI
jgi:hypothetical protein